MRASEVQALSVNLQQAKERRSCRVYVTNLDLNLDGPMTLLKTRCMIIFQEQDVKDRQLIGCSKDADYKIGRAHV